MAFISARWLYYYYHPSWAERRNPGRGQLRYSRNDVMDAANAGDLLIVGRRSDSEISFYIIQQGHPAIGQVYEFITTDSAVPQTETRPSFWLRIFGSSKKEEIAPEEPLLFESDDIILRVGLTRTDIDIFKDNETGKTVISGTITRFQDGDSFMIQDIFRVRLAGIDAPEIGQTCKDARGRDYDCGDRALKQLQRIVGKRKVVCTHNRFEKWGRHLWSCENARGQNIAHEMIAAGHAVAYLTKDKTLRDAESDARESKRGIWSGEFQPPAGYRKTRTGR